MYAFKIAGKAVKPFMNQLLREALMDHWEVRGVEVNNLARFEIDGQMEGTDQEQTNGDQEKTIQYHFWENIRPFVFFLIKEGGKPKKLKIVFSLPHAQVHDVHPNGAAFFLNMLYEGDEILFTAASSEIKFSMDRSVHAAWSDYIKDMTKSWTKEETEDE